jgi:hypothetical protein
VVLLFLVGILGEINTLYTCQGGGKLHNYKTPGANPKQDIVGWLGKDL